VSAETRVVARKGDHLEVDLRLAHHNGAGCVSGHRVVRFLVPIEQPNGTAFLAFEPTGARATLAGNLGSAGKAAPMRHSLVADMRKHVRRATRDAAWHAATQSRFGKGA
jgi:hypothetical protein